MVKLYDNLGLNMDIRCDLDLDEATGTVVRDRSKNRSHGTLAGGAATPTWTQLPNGIWVLDFDGGDNISLGQPAPLLVDYISVEAYINWDTLDATEEKGVVSKGSAYHSPTRSWELVVWTNGSVRFYVSTDGTNLEYGSGPAVTITGTWYHVMGTFDGASILCYVNGVPGSAGLLSGTLNQGPRNILVGSGYRAGAPSNRFDGRIGGKIGIWPYALTRFQVRQRYLSTKWRVGL